MTSSKSSECFAEYNNDSDFHSNAGNKLKEYENYQNNNLSSLSSYIFHSEILASGSKNQEIKELIDGSNSDELRRENKKLKEK